MTEPPNEALHATSVRRAALLLASGGFALWPSDAHAQRIPWVVVPLAASPLVAVFLSAVVGIAMKSWLIGLGNTGLVIVWVAWFVAASKYSTSDFAVWTPIAVLGLHSLVMLWLIVRQALRRAKASGG